MVDCPVLFFFFFFFFFQAEDGIRDLTVTGVQTCALPIYLVHTPVTALPGRPWVTLLPPAWADQVSRAVTERTPSTTELRSAERSLLFSAIPLAEPGAAVLVFEDQTDKRRLQEQLIQSEKMSAIGQLVAGVAHDLNNPLASVVGLSDFLAETGDISAALAEPLQVIRQEAERAATIVKNLLSFARSQEGERQRSEERRVGKE